MTIFNLSKIKLVITAGEQMLVVDGVTVKNAS